MRNPFDNIDQPASFETKRKFVQEYQEKGLTKYQRVGQIHLALGAIIFVPIIICPPIAFLFIGLYLCRK